MSQTIFCLLLILSAYGSAKGQGDSDCYRTILQVGSCPKNCISFSAQSRCYACKEGCSPDSSSNDSCDPSLRTSCESDEVCLATGITGQNECIDRIEYGEPCVRSYDGEFDADDLRGKVDLTSGILEREDISVIPEAVVPCREGLVCMRETLENYVCQWANNTVCLHQRLTDADILCDDEGNFEPLQCRRADSGDGIECRCVSRDGEVIEGTEMTVASRSEAPDCEDRKCSYVSQLGNLYQASSGTNFIDYKRCAVCLCSAGEPNFCVSQRRDVCNRINPAPKVDRSCTMRGKRMEHGEIVMVGCTSCRCSNGNLQCLKRVCEDEKDDDPVDDEDQSCLACRNRPVSPVCGSDGKTYPSACVATFCRGLDSADIVPGSCRQKDVCVSYPCNNTEICLRRGGVTCLSRSGCRNARRFRQCVNIQNIQCSTNSSDDDAVCGNDGNSYPSLCKLLQSAAGVRVLYGNRCDAAECSGGQVCGTDGETYSNICELQAQSANARVDYRGECIDLPPETMDGDRCERIRASGMCADLSDCNTIIRPDDGCCPICGGGLIIGFDRDALEEFLTINPSAETLDDLMVRILSSGFISKEALSRCTVEGSLSDEGNLFIAFEAKERADNFCNALAKRLASVINNPPTNDTSAAITSVPQELQFATVAESSALVSESEDPTFGGDQTVKGSISALILASILLMSLLV